MSRQFTGPTRSRAKPEDQHDNSTVTKKENKKVASTHDGHLANLLLTPAEVAAAFRVDPKTVTRWAKAGKLSSLRTLGGHRRYLEAEVLEKLENAAVNEDLSSWLAQDSGPSRDV
jgi:excisionase family DNA binding protein